MAVDADELRHRANALEYSAIGYEPAVDTMREAADEIDSLRAQLAEAKAAAIPWRDGPARGGVMPESIEPRSILLTVFAETGRLGIATGVFRRMDSEYLVLKFDPKYDSAYALASIVRWCYVSDLLPSDAAKPGEASDE